MKILLLTFFAISCFAFNSILCRVALRTNQIDAASFTLIRLLSGALLLTMFLKLKKGHHVLGPFDRISALALVGYAIFFSLSYTSMDAGVGAFLLFGSVQATMLGQGLIKKSSPTISEKLGLCLALCGLALLTIPGKNQPDLNAAILMILAGISWGLYSLRGKGVQNPLVSTTRNFIFSLPFALLFSIYTYESFHLTINGAAIALVSGAITSGLGYTIWYAVIPFLGTNRAAIIQLSVPVLAMVLAMPLLSERPAALSLFAGLLTLAGVAISLTGGKVQKEKSTRA